MRTLSKSKGFKPSFTPTPKLGTQQELLLYKGLIYLQKATPNINLGKYFPFFVKAKKLAQHHHFCFFFSQNSLFFVRLKYKGVSSLSFPLRGGLSYITKLRSLINHLSTKEHPMIDTFKLNPFLQECCSTRFDG